MLSSESDARLALAVQVLDSHKALELVLLDLSDLDAFTDRFLLASATSTQHLDTLVEELGRAFKDRGFLPRFSGKPLSGWVVVDCGDLVIHLFLESTRAFYQLEEFWHEAAQLELDDWLHAPLQPLDDQE